MLKRLMIRACVAAVVVLYLSALANAKRVSPPEVKGVRVGDVEYTAPSGHMGYVDAVDSKTGRVMWSRQIYVVIKDPELEGDVQDVFINSLAREGDKLIITNEWDAKFEMDLATLEVKTLRGKVRQEKGR